MQLNVGDDVYIRTDLKVDSEQSMVGVTQYMVDNYAGKRVVITGKKLLESGIIIYNVRLVGDVCNRINAFYWWRIEFFDLLKSALISIF